MWQRACNGSGLELRLPGEQLDASEYISGVQWIARKWWKEICSHVYGGTHKLAVNSRSPLIYECTYVCICTYIHIFIFVHLYVSMYVLIYISGFSFAVLFHSMSGVCPLLLTYILKRMYLQVCVYSWNLYYLSIFAWACWC